MLASAVDGGRLARNVAEGVALPKIQRREMCFLDAVQVELLAAAITAPYGLLVRFAAYSGLRPEELVALRVGRLDLLGGTVRVAEAATEVGGLLEWGGVKTYEARTVRLPRFLCEQLAAYLAERSHGPRDLVFASPLGGPHRQNNFMGRHFRPAVRRAGLPDELRFYDLRHTAAALMIREGASVKAVQAQLGHRSAVTTLDRYGHLFPDETERLAERLDRTRAAALAAGVWPHGGPRSSSSAKVQVNEPVGGCERGDSNPHGLPHRDLNPARLPFRHARELRWSLQQRVRGACSVQVVAGRSWTAQALPSGSLKKMKEFQRPPGPSTRVAPS